MLGVWVSFESSIVENLVVAGLPEETRALPPERLNLVINDIRNLAEGNIVSGEVVPEMRAAADHYLELGRTAAAASAVVVLCIGIAGASLAWRRVSPSLRARNQVEQIIRFLLIASSTVAIFTTLGIVLSVLFEAILFFGHIPIADFVLGLDWSPQMAIREDQVGSSGAFGAIPLFAGTLLISFIAMTVAAPIGLFAAIYLAEYATPASRSIAKPVLEILAGIPTVVYGFFAALIVAPVIRDTGSIITMGIERVSLDIGGNEVLAMIGPSGCGKSTFLRCLNRMNDTVDICRVSGSIKLDGVDIHDPRLDVVQLRARVGMVFQKPNPFPKSIYDNVAYGPRIHGLVDAKRETDAIVQRSLEKAGLWDEVKDRLEQPGTGLSGGQQQRLCIARAIAVSPEVILMDEPCSALDPIATARIEELIDELRENYTIVIVTHSMQQAARVSQRTAYFHLGKLIEVGETNHVFTNPRHKLTEDYITGRFG